jgi:putative membrane protein
MHKLKAFIQQFNWKIVLIRILVNGASLALTVMIIPDISFVTQNYWTVIISAVGLGILNAIVKPIILLLTGQFIFVTFGLLVILVNALMLYLLEWLFPNILAVNSLFWALIGGAVLGVVSNALENLLGLTPPIVSEENLELRKRIEAEQPISLASLVAKPQASVPSTAETQPVSEQVAAQAALEALQAAEIENIPAAPNQEVTPEPLEDSLPLPDESQTADTGSSEPQPGEQTTGMKKEDAE